MKKKKKLRRVVLGQGKFGENPDPNRYTATVGVTAPLKRIRSMIGKRVRIVAEVLD